MNLRPRLFSNRPPPRWTLTLLACLAVGCLLLGLASAPAGAATYSSTLYLSGASSSVVGGGYQLVGSVGASTTARPAPVSALNCSSCGGNLGVPSSTAYSYKYTLVDAGGETSPSAVSNTTSALNGKITVSSLPTGITVRLYRASNANGPWKRVVELTNNASSTYLDNIADASLGALMPQAQTRTTLSTGTGYYEYAPGNALSDSSTSNDFAKVAGGTPVFDGKGWVVDGSGGDSFAAGTWSVTVKITSSATTGTARLDVGMWIVNDSGAVVGSSPLKPLIDPACTVAPCGSGGVPGENGSANIATGAGTASAITTNFTLPAFSLARNQHLYVQFWRHQTAATLAGNTVSTLAAYDGVNQITHPAANAFPNVPALGSIAARVNAAPQLAATFSDPDASDTGTMSFQICSDPALTTNCQSGSSSSGILNGSSGGWTPPAALVDGTTYYWDAQATDSAGNVSGWSSTSSFVYDTTPPTVSGVTASNANGAYKAGQTIHVQIDFPEAVNVTGSPKLALNTSPAESATYASGSGTSTLTFDYTVQAGDTAAALDYAGIGALTLNGGTIADLATNNATLTLAAPGAAGSLSAGKSLTIDTTAPTVSSVSASNANGGYKAGQTIHVQMTFSEPVNVTGSPQLALDTTPAESAAYTSGSGTSTLTFDYTVQTGDNVATLGYTGTGALGLNGGTIADPAGNSATLTLASPGAPGSLSASKSIRIDTNPPATPSLGAPTDGSYLGAAPALHATFSNSDPGDTGTLDFQICADAGCSSVVQSGSSASGLTDGASASWTPSGLADGVYYWHARGTDAVGNQSGWAAVRSFTLDTTAPTTPALGAIAARITTTPQLSATFSDPGATDNGTLAFQLCSNSSCASVLQSSTTGAVANGANGNWTPSSLADGAYYWRVRAQDSAGNLSSWSATSAFTVDTVAPGLPTFGSPANGSRTNSAQLDATFVDSDATDSGTVGFQLCSDAACSSVLSSSTSATVGGGTSVSWTPGGLADGTYYWRLRGQDVAGNQSSWTSSRSFVLDTNPPATPSLTSPADDAYLGAVPAFGATFSSADAGDSGTIDYQLCSDSGCSAVVQSGSSSSGLADGESGSWTPGGLGGGTFYWRARADDAAGNQSAWSATSEFTVDTAAPSVPVQTAPGDGARVNRPAALDATYSDGGGDAGSVIFQACTTSACTTVAASATVGGVPDNTGAAWTPTGLRDGTYYWRARSQDSAANQSAWSSVRSFTIDGTPPATPVLVGFAGVHVRTAPALTALVDDPGGDAADSVRLLVELCNDPACTEVVTTGYSGSVPPGTLAGWQAPQLPDGSYYWRALAEDLAGNQSPWSAVDSFVIDTAAPSVPAMVGPAVGAIVNTARLSAVVTGLSRGGDSGLEFQVCADAACANVVASGYVPVAASGGAPTWTPTGLGDGFYFWRLSAHDQAGNESAWSTTMSFVLDRTPPGKPRGLTAKLNGRTLTLRWKVPARAHYLAGYVLLVDGRRAGIVTAKTHSIRLKLRKGEARLFAVAAFDAAGNVGRPAILVGPDLIRLTIERARGAATPKAPAGPHS